MLGDPFLAILEGTSAYARVPNSHSGPRHDEIKRASIDINEPTGPDGAVAMSSANGLVGTGFAYRYRFIPIASLWRANGWV